MTARPGSPPRERSSRNLAIAQITPRVKTLAAAGPPLLQPIPTAVSTSRLRQ